MKKVIIGICLINMFYLGGLAYDGQLDASFKGTGIVRTFINNFSVLSATAIQDDGKIVAAGSSGVSNLMNNFTLARYNTNGTLDTTFGTLGTGIVVTSIGGTVNAINAIVIQTDGKIVVAGRGTAADTLVVARYNTNGTLDETFGNLGIVVTGVNTPAAFFGVALQKDGKIVAVGQPTTGITRFIVVRYYPDGTVDNGSQGGSGFGVNGIVSFTIAEDDEARSIAVQENGKIVVGGSSRVAGVRNFAIARLTTGGSLDTTFGGNGIVTTSFSPVDAQASNLIVQPNGKIVLVGSVGILNSRDFALVRYEEDGTLDTEFGTNGRVITDVGDDDRIFQVVLQPNGRLVVGGVTLVSGMENFVAARYTSNGSLDLTFNPSGSTPGIVITFLDDAASAFQIALQQNGRIVLSGTMGANEGFALVRYLNNNPLVATRITSPLDNALFSNATFAISGVAQNPSNIGIFSNGTLIGRAVTSGSENSWSTVTTVPLENGPHTIVAVAEYKDGNVNLASADSVTICINACRSSLSAAIACKYCSSTPS